MLSMKISKINHSRAGISVRQDQKTSRQGGQGVLYNSPAKDGEVQINLKTHVLNCNRKAQGLYNVINPEIDFCTGNTLKKKQFESLARNFNYVMKKALNSSHSSDANIRIKEEVTYFLHVFSDIDKKKLLVEIAEDQDAASVSNIKENKTTSAQKMIRELVFRKMRKSLRKRVKVNDDITLSMTDILEKMIEAVCICGRTESFDREILMAFFKQVDKDYTKEEQQKLIVKSIESQSVKVRIAEKNGKYVLQTANAEHKKKKYVFEFMKQYAGAKDNTEQIKLTEHIQALIWLYLYGPDGYQDVAYFRENITDNEDFLDPEYLPLLQEIHKLTDIIQENKEILKRDKTLKNNDPGKLKSEMKKQIVKENQEYSNELRTKEESVKNLSVQVMLRRYRKAVDYLADEVKTTILGDIPNKKIGSSADLFWIDYIDDTVKKLILNNNRKNESYRFQMSYLYNHVWKEWTQYMASKYIDLGKAAYHFAVPDLSRVSDGEPVSICEVRPEYRNGISSFEYERIKAEESLEREMAEYVSFAVNNFARAVAPDEEREKDGREDVLCRKAESEITKSGEVPITLYKDADRRILQFFGGKSHFKNNEDSMINLYSGEELYIALRNELNDVRNMTFHYTTRAESSKTNNHEIAINFFEEEMDEISSLFRKKYYSNNVPEFYSVEDIDNMMKKIYSGRKYRNAQIPAFNRIISRPALPQMMNGFVNKNPLKEIKKNQDRMAIERYWSCLFFVLKELYYYDFLQEQEQPKKNVKERFFQALRDQLNKETDQTKKKALEDFDKRINKIGRNHSFGEICQGLMIDYMLQNTDNKMVRKQNSKNDSQKKDNQIYKHYRTILYICLRDAFMEYLQENWQFLRKPLFRSSKIEEDEFCSIKESRKRLSLYDHIKDSFGKDALSPSWYIAAHFINPKYLNHLIGSIRNYLQFTADIEQRAGNLHNRTDVQRKQKDQQYQNILEILEFTIHFCGQTTNVMEDYFESDQAYAQYLSDFVEYNTTKKVPDIETALHIFCDQKFKLNGEVQSVGIYYDGGNLIPNRNIIQANMYGNASSLKNSMQRIKSSEIRNMYKAKSDLDAVLKDGICRTEEEQRKLREFQNCKNRIELLDVSIYTEILNDMQGQLINWSYMRERDLMYYQLGYYYTKLFWTDSIAKEDPRRQLIGKKVKIEDGAVLYQILALNSYTLPVISNIDGEVKPILDNGSIGGKAIGQFRKNYKNADLVYEEGLSLFENTDEHGDIIKTRDYIDHFKYFVKTDRSMMDLYSEVYDRFFRHDHKLKKSVSFVLTNIMAKNFMTIHTKMELENKTIGKGHKEHKAAKIVIADKGLKSTALTYTIKPDSKDEKNEKKKESVLVDARSDIFLSQLEDILEYKQI